MNMRNFELLTQTAVKTGTGGALPAAGFIFITDKMSLRYNNKVVIVTGGSKGIGRGIVKAFGTEIIVIIDFTIFVIGSEHFAYFFF